MSDETLRTVGLTRTGLGRYEATNVRGGTLSVGGGDDNDFSPVELLLVAIAGCSAADVDHITSKRSAPTHFEATMSGDKVRDESGNHMTNLKLVFDITFPDDDGGAQALAVLPRAVAQTHDRLCTVSRTVQLGTPIEIEVT
jgi:uncharacterized OsmC-like protein